MSGLSTNATRADAAPCADLAPQQRQDAPAQVVDLSVVIVTHNTRDLVLACLESVFDSQLSSTFEVLVVDNASSDGTSDAIRQAFPNVRLFQSDSNLGFAAANNRAIKAARGEHVLLLNPDTRIGRDSLQTMLSHLQSNDGIGVVGCKVCLPDGSLDKACKRGFPTPGASLAHFLQLPRLFPRNEKINAYQLAHLDDDEDHAVDAVSGCCMMVRRSAFEQAGLLDETFFMYGEDIDWCYRIKQAGWAVRYHPATTITHFKGGSSSGGMSFRVMYEFYRAMAVFYRKHDAPKRFILTNAMVYTGIGLLLAGATVKNVLRRIMPI